MITKSVEWLKHYLIYDPDTGVFRWRIDMGRRYKAGRIAGHVNPRKGYRRIMIEQKAYPAHHLAWLWTYGKFPKDEIDHINLNEDDNRISNLREATRSQNNGNRGISPKNSSGFKGVWYEPKSSRNKPWRAKVKHNGIQYYLGNFTTPEEAHQAYADKARELFGEYARAK